MIAKLILAAALGAALPATAQAPVALPAGLTGETCQASARVGAKPLRGLPADQVISCGDKPAGSVAFGPLLSPLPAGDAREAALRAAFSASTAWAVARQGVTCEEPRWLDGTALVVPCRARSGGWPTLVVAAADGQLLRVAAGPASLYPVLRAAANAPVAAGATRAAMTDQVQGLWATPIVLASAADIDRVRSLLRDARTATSLARYDDAEELFRKALDVQERLFSANDTAAADILIDLALVVSNQGRADEAAALFRRAAPIMEKSPNGTDRARLATYRGYEAANRGDYPAALANAAQATALWRAAASGGPGVAGLSGTGPVGGAAEAEMAMTRNLEARMMLRVGDVVSAYAAAGEALLTLDKVEGEPQYWRSDVLVTLGEISAAQGRVAAAEAYFNSALALRKQIFGEGVGTLRVRAALGRAYRGEGLNTSAIITYREAFKVARALPAGSVPFTNQDLVPFAAAIVDYAATLTDPKERQGLFAEAFDAFQLVRSPVIDQTIGQATARLAASDPEIGKLLSAMAESQRAASLARIRLANAQSQPRAERNAVAEDALTAEIAKATADARATRGTLDTKFPDFAAISEKRGLTLDQVRERLGAKEGVVSFLIGRDSSFAQLVRRDSIEIAAVPQGEVSLRASVRGLRRALEIEGGSVGDFDIAASYSLYRDLMGGIEPAMAGLDRLSIIPAGPLSSLPFAVLVTKPGQPGNYQGAAWLNRSMTISHAPSLAAFVTLRATRPATKPDLPLLAFGNPILGPAKGKAEKGMAALTAACGTGGAMPAGLLRSLASLPDTESEMQMVARTLGAPASSVHGGALADEKALRSQELARYRVLYFATHGLLPGELKCQSEPGLVLTPPSPQATSAADDGLLGASEVAALSINADLVVLSACNTAAGGGALGGESLSGLSEAFFYAGARNMLISHWQVPSAATTALMGGLFAEVRGDVAGGAADALRRSQLRLAADARTAHPFFWGAFVLMGDGGSPAVQTAEVRP